MFRLTAYMSHLYVCVCLNSVHNPYKLHQYRTISCMPTFSIDADSSEQSHVPSQTCNYDMTSLTLSKCCCHLILTIRGKKCTLPKRPFTGAGPSRRYHGKKYNVLSLFKCFSCLNVTIVNLQQSQSFPKMNYNVSELLLYV